MGGTIGNDSNCTWQVPMQEKRLEDLGKVQAFKRPFQKILTQPRATKKH